MWYQKFITAAIHILFCTFINAQIPRLSSNPGAVATVYIDFDGHTVAGTAWNWDSTIRARPAGLSTAVITEAFNRAAEDFRIFNINITTDSNSYKKAPANRRVRIIVTPTYNWYGIAGGVSFVGSFNWGDGTPAWVFSTLLENNPKYIGEAIAHEAGHTLGLQHQSTYDRNCNLVAEYAEGKGTGETSWAPVMGVSYYKNVTTWHIGKSIEGCNVIQNDIDVMTKGESKIPLRADDHGNTMQSATLIPSTSHQFQSDGVISSGSDKDVFKVVLARGSVLKASAIPNHFGNYNSGANIDIKISVLKTNGDTIYRNNPANLLSASIDTSLTSGTYYIVIDGVSNQNLSDYGSVGYYSLTGSIASVLPATRLIVKGEVNWDKHVLGWRFEADEPLKETIVETSHNGVDFKKLVSLPSSAGGYSYRPNQFGTIYYRMKAVSEKADNAYYSNVISLENTGHEAISLVGGSIVKGFTGVRVSSDCSYHLLDETGRLLQKGKLVTGINQINIAGIKKGLLLLKVFNQSDQRLFRLMKP